MARSTADRRDIDPIGSENAVPVDGRPYASDSPTSRQLIWRKLLSLIDGAILVTIMVWLLFISDAVLTIWLTAGEQVELTDAQKSSIQNIIKVFLALSGYVLIVYFRGILEIFIRNPFYVLLIMLSWASMFWSIDPDITFRRCIILTSFSILAGFVALRYELDTIVKALMIVSVIGVAISLYYIILQPSLGLNFDGRGIRGAFGHKNIFGVFLLGSLIAALTTVKLNYLPRWMGFAYLGLILALLVLTNAATAWMAAIAMIGIYVLSELARLPSKIFAILIAFSAAVVCFLALMVIIYLQDLFLAIDRDATLTGRDVIWAYALSMIEERALLGHGYAAFWESEPILSYVTEVMKWRITHAHSGYLQVSLELGLVGLTFLMLHIVHCVVRFIAANPPLSLRTFVLPALVGFLVYNTAETLLLIGKNFGWVVMLICLFMTTPGLDRLRERFARPSS